MGLIRLLSIVALICPAAFGNREDTLRVFKCANGKQVQKAWLCDGEDDCGDNSDEKLPECEAPVSCGPGEFTCKDNGLCIPRSQVCDREPDCGDRSDEDPGMCHSRDTECQPGQFKCTDKECIPAHWVCDGTSDCRNGLDESSCNRTCTSSEFKCGDGNCIDNSWKCDGDYDCTDGSDEEGCSKKNRCSQNDFTCQDGSCVPLRFLCDGDFDCADRSDEANCTQADLSHGLKTCRENQFECPDKLTCIHVSWVCDQQSDCPDGADESPAYCSNVCSSGMFQCTNKQCLPGSAQCDGVIDCNDGSDEENCQGQKFCSAHEIDCGSGLCLTMDKACNGVQECANGADESPKCGVNECSHKNGGCDHSCVDDPIGFHCKCHEGFKLLGNSTCVDINECNEHYGSCSQICTNSIGSFSCSCHQGYVVDQNDHTRCTADVKTAQLIFTKREDVRKVSISDPNDQQMSIIVNDTKTSMALDFYYENQEIYWSETDQVESMIYKSDIDGLMPKRPVIASGMKTVEGLAVDWVHGNIYWTDTGKKTIEVSDLGGNNRKTLISTGLEEPRALVVDPEEGCMFWTDWGKNAKIEKAGLDGSNRQTIVSHTIKWPNGLTLDYDQKRIYWVDAKLYAIYSATYDGSDRRLVVKSADFLHHPYSVTLFQDQVYWSDWETQMIYKADKFDGRNLEPLSGEKRTLQNPMVLQVYHPYRQVRTENQCKIAECSHLCLPKPKVKGRGNSSVVCACPDGMVKMEDGKGCGVPIVRRPSAAPTSSTTPGTRVPPIYIDFVPPEIPSVIEQAREINWLLVLFIILVGSILTTFVLVSVCVCAYKLYLNGNFKIMNFDNPIYHKTPTQDPLCTVESSEPSAPSTPEELRTPFCPV
uniref:Very low-density lipoprotein receptor n=2 Tax=Lygus hesperus TaxID=30085 RepID=A0A146LA52_LYGHE